MTLCKKKFYSLILFSSSFVIACFGSDKEIPGEIDSELGEGQVTGRVITSENLPVSGAVVTFSVRGTTYSATTPTNGRFSITLDKAARNDGFNVQITKTNFENANRAAVIKMHDLKLDLGDIPIYIVGHSQSVERTISGRVLNGFSYEGLSDSIVAIQDSLGRTVSATTDSKGQFVVTSRYFALGSSYQLSVYRSDYATRNDLTAQITAIENEADNTPMRLYPLFGGIKGVVYNDGNPSSNPSTTGLSGATVTITDSNGNSIPRTTNGAGEYSFGPPNYPAEIDFLLGETYFLNVSATDHWPQTNIPVKVTLTGENSAPNIYMRVQATISGNVTGPAGGTTTVTLSTAAPQIIKTLATTTTNGAGAYSFTIPDVIQGRRYTVSFSSPGYISQTLCVRSSGPPACDPSSNQITLGNNIVNVTLAAAPAPTSWITGRVGNYFPDPATNFVDGATVQILRASDRSILYTGTTSNMALIDASLPQGSGTFRINVNLTNGINYILRILKSGFSGDSDVNAQEVTFTYNQGGGAGQVPFVNVAGANYYNLLHANSGVSISQSVLFPIGVYVNVGTGSSSFPYDIKQTYEAFLTDKIGLTISARREISMVANRSNATLQNRREDASAFYIHLDDTANPISALPPGAKTSTTLALNGSSIPGIVHNGIRGDSRTTAWGLNQTSFYNFFVHEPGTVSLLRQPAAPILF